MCGCHHTQSRLWRDAARILAMQGNADPRGRLFRRDTVQKHLIQRQPQRVGCATVHGDDAPLDRAVVPPAQYRFGHTVRARSRHQEPQQHQRAGHRKRRYLFWQRPPNRKQHKDAKDNTTIVQRIRFNLETKERPDPHSKAHRHPAQELPALCTRNRTRPVDDHAQRRTHACPRSPHWINKRKP